ncbi:anaerobic sulfatase maturase [Clostridium fallax]|uniref:Radical SAM core domain-containing protein n=1 Tax=Clostridium fallax TaxID=1533 RepID=A0A1M4W665_9CLOT|nr:anaerobic sulfatase maturase [Clostridium fallax]SHE76716.1 uncharacterized protein SAMN05443638_11087 [Clostridium fallax]SQB22903.1 anaerobic sulfatase-maturase [Clostridium fallax]
MNHISFLIKPASSSCNLRCKYCFYCDIADNRSVENYGIMEDSLAETLIKRAFDENAKMITFAFQGGEPTLAGLDFFKKFVAITKKYNTNNTIINFSLQTNGFSLNNKWAEFFKANNFLIGISLDGPKDIHDSLRITQNKKGSFNKVMHSIKLLKSFDIPFNILSVLTSFNSKHITKVYNFFKKEKFTHLQFIPCIEPFEYNEHLSKYSLKNDEYTYALNTLFKLYKEDFLSGNYTSIRLFDNYIQMCLGYPPENCGLSGVCSCYFVIESNGDVFPCDFYALDKYKLGNISDNSFNNIKEISTAKNFIRESTLIDEKCIKCKYRKLCNGGCKRYRTLITDSNIPMNYYCNAYYNFFDTNIDGLMEIATILKSRYNLKNRKI